MFVRIGNLIRKELIQFRRDRLLSFFIVLVPALQLILMARAVDRGIAEQPVVVLDQDQSRLSRELAVKLDNSEELKVRYRAQTFAQVTSLLDTGRARLAVIVPAGFARELGGLRPAPPMQLLIDATNSMAASIVLQAAQGVISRFAADLAGDQGLILPEFVDFRTSVRFNPNMDVRDYSIPAMMGFITYQVTLAVAALGLARERELGTLEQLMVTPLRRVELALGKGLPALAVGMLNFAVLWAIGLTVFRVPMEGSPILLGGLTLLFVSAVVGWGLFLSTISRTQQQAILFVFIQALTDIALSGFLVPVRNMPGLLRAASRFVPLQYYLVIIRGIMLKGAGLAVLWPQAAALAALSLAMGLLALSGIARRVE